MHFNHQIQIMLCTHTIHRLWYVRRSTTQHTYTHLTHTTNRLCQHIQTHISTQRTSTYTVSSTQPDLNTALEHWMIKVSSTSEKKGEDSSDPDQKSSTLSEAEIVSNSDDINVEILSYVRTNWPCLNFFSLLNSMFAKTLEMVKF